MANNDPSAPAKPSGKQAVVVTDATEADRQRADARRMQDALEDDEVREALRSLQIDRAIRRK